jgi:hypothetical protein
MHTKAKRKIFMLQRVALSAATMLVVSISEAIAQCAMCRASVETNVNVDGIGLADKLNTGILYLFVTPYLLAMVVGYFWYKKSKEHRQNLLDAQQRKERIVGL